MPPVNQAAVSAGVIALSVAVAAAIAVYESPELRRLADDFRRRIAIALHSIGDGITPPNREPLFNRPEDAEGFLRSRGVAAGADAGVDADEETRRRQREELMYWNQLHLEKQEKERQEEEVVSRGRTSTQGSSFDDFLKKDGSGESGTYVFNTGADVRGSDEGLIRRHAPQGVRGLNASMYADPFGDEHGIAMDEHPVLEASSITPDRDEGMSEMYYHATPEVTAAQPVPAAMEGALFDAWDQSSSDRPRTPERELDQDEYMTAGQADRNEVYASIAEWAQTSNPSFYSPLPVSPAAPLSEPELISDGVRTPADSASSADSGEDFRDDAVSQRSATEDRDFDVMSEDSDGIATPTSWTEVGSVISESDAGAGHA